MTQRENLWVKLKLDFMRPQDIEKLHQSYVCDMKMEQQGCTMTKMEGYFGLDSELSGFFQQSFSFLETEISFESFAFYLWNICTLHEKDFASFIFGVYSEKGRDDICRDHFIDLLKIFNKGAYENGKGSTFPHVRYSARTLGLFFKENLEYLLPVQRLQRLLRRKCFGEEYWKKSMKKRYTKRELQCPVTVAELFNLHYEIRIKSSSPAAATRSFYSSQHCFDIVDNEVITTFAKNPYDCLVSLQVKSRDVCSDCCSCSDPETDSLDIDCSHPHPIFSPNSASRSPFDSYRNQIKLLREYSPRESLKARKNTTKKKKFSQYDRIRVSRRVSAVPAKRHLCYSNPGRICPY